MGNCFSILVIRKKVSSIKMFKSSQRLMLANCAPTSRLPFSAGQTKPSQCGHRSGRVRMCCAFLPSAPVSFSVNVKKNKKKSVEGDDFDCVVPSVESDIVIREYGGMFFFL